MCHLRRVLDLTAAVDACRASHVTVVTALDTVTVSSYTIDVFTEAAVQVCIIWPYHPFLRLVGGSEMISEGKMSTDDHRNRREL